MTEQRAPYAGRQPVTGAAINDFVTTIYAQAAKGEAKYGRPLETHNGRDAGRDAWEEFVDLGAYLTQLRMEHADLVAENAVLRAEITMLRAQSRRRVERNRRRAGEWE